MKEGVRRYYDENELDCLHDTVLNSIEQSLTVRDLMYILADVSESIMEIGEENGLCDTVFSDMLFVYLRQIKGLEI